MDQAFDGSGTVSPGQQQSKIFLIVFFFNGIRNITFSKMPET